MCGSRVTRISRSCSRSATTCPSASASGSFRSCGPRPPRSSPREPQARRPGCVTGARPLRTRTVAARPTKHGNFLEEFHPGQVFRHRRGKTITEGLFAVFTDFAFTTNSLAKNVRYARAYGFRGLVAPPGLVMNVVFSQSVEDVSENGRANLEYIDMRFGVPVCVGDTIEADR